MDEPFIIPLNYKGADREFEATLQVLGYTHRFKVDVDGTEVLFERDEEGRYRAILSQEVLAGQGKGGRSIDPGLLEHIALQIEQFLS
jgi:hypothetical protein